MRVPDCVETPLLLDDLPVLLTVEEAGRVLRISRGLAYELARQWLTTEGATGLPVVRIGRILRVPRARLELIVSGDAPLTSPAACG